MKRTEIKRAGWLRRRSPMPRGTCHIGRSPIRKRNPKHARQNFMRAYGGDERVQWFQRQPCLICGAVPSENAHVPSRSGMGRKGDARWIVPLCGSHHRTAKDSLHALNIEGFNAAHDVEIETLAHIYDARWEAECARTENAHQQDFPAEVRCDDDA